MKDIQYINGNPPVFQITYDDIKSGKSCVRTGDYIHFVASKMFSYCFNISPFINCDLTISPFQYYSIYSSQYFTLSIEIYS